MWPINSLLLIFCVIVIDAFADQQQQIVTEEPTDAEKLAARRFIEDQRRRILQQLGLESDQEAATTRVSKMLTNGNSFEYDYSGESRKKRKSKEKSVVDAHHWPFIGDKTNTLCVKFFIFVIFSGSIPSYLSVKTMGRRPSKNHTQEREMERIFHSG